MPDQADAAIVMRDESCGLQSFFMAGQRVKAILLARLEVHRKSIVEGRLRSADFHTRF